MKRVWMAILVLLCAGCGHRVICREGGTGLADPECVRNGIRTGDEVTVFPVDGKPIRGLYGGMRPPDRSEVAPAARGDGSILILSPATAPMTYDSVRVPIRNVRRIESPRYLSGGATGALVTLFLVFAGGLFYLSSLDFGIR